MTRHVAIAAVVVCLGLPIAATSLRPEITGVTPDTPAPSRTSQVLTVNGREFAAGVALSITSPGGRMSDYRGNAITDLRDMTFRVSVILADAGAYRLIVTNPDGQTSMPFTLNVKAPADGPVLREVKPIGLRISTSPQVLTILGARFNPGLNVSVTDPAGNVQQFSGDAITRFLPESFELTLPLETAGRYELVVTNPNGKVSNSMGFDVGRTK